MGGQACVLYGAAQFSRDTDLAILAEAENLKRLQAALDDLQAVVIAVPPFEQRYLEMGLGVHFRCQAAECEGIRIDVLSRMRGAEEFSKLWSRRTTFQTDEGSYDLLALPDLVQAKKTQRAKDWPMIKALVDVHYFHHRHTPNEEQVRFWLMELRSTECLCEVVRNHASAARSLVSRRPLIAEALADEPQNLERLLAGEEQREREADRAYWVPLRAELERLRHAARGSSHPASQPGETRE